MGPEDRDESMGATLDELGAATALPLKTLTQGWQRKARQSVQLLQLISSYRFLGEKVAKVTVDGLLQPTAGTCQPIIALLL